MRPPRESYVRVTTEHDGWTCEPAIEHRPGDSFEALAAALRNATMAAPFTVTGDQMARAEWIGGELAKLFPDRAYFVEVWQHGRDGFAQVFQPFGVPRNEAVSP